MSSLRCYKTQAMVQLLSQVWKGWALCLEQCLCGAPGHSKWSSVGLYMLLGQTFSHTLFLSSFKNFLIQGDPNWSQEVIAP